ncbi:MAG: hypothetical protein ACE5Q6_15855 [Dehalococcoidia bacterium]
MVIKDAYRDNVVIPATERRKLLQALGPEEGRRYDAVLDQYQRLRDVIGDLNLLANQVKLLLLERDRLL